PGRPGDDRSEMVAARCVTHRATAAPRRRGRVRLACAALGVFGALTASAASVQPRSIPIDREWDLLTPPAEHGKRATLLEAGQKLGRWSFELSLARSLGYTPELACCVVCGGPPKGGSSFGARRGGIVCGNCVSEEPGARPLSDAGATILAALPRTPDADIPTAVRDEIGETLRDFLEEHAGRELRLKSLDFLAQIRRTGHFPVESEREHEG
ncbi:MAG: DNA repair protein RecO C-terminal domain-containing protein, partial [Candidatus Eisenbacteria bacterium]